MAVLIIALVLGLFIFFVGLSLISLYRKEEASRKKPAEAEDDKRRELTEEELSKPLPETNRTYLLGLLFGGEGLILSALAATALLFNGLAVKIRWYISLPALIIYLAAAIIFDSLKMYRR